jgi:acetyl-CoA C-acetyltransferase
MGMSAGHHAENAASVGRSRTSARCAAAHERDRQGRFKAEIVPVAVPGRKGATTFVDTDEGPRADATAEALGKLQPAFTPSGTVTAGNAPGFTDGAAAVVVAGRETVEAHGLHPMARVLGYASAATDPLWLFEAPELALNKLFKKTGTRLEDWDLLEINEAFAAQIVANGKAMGWDWDRST